jgi:hypothetical protein
MPLLETSLLIVRRFMLWREEVAYLGHTIPGSSDREVHLGMSRLVWPLL